MKLYNVVNRKFKVKRVFENLGLRMETLKSLEIDGFEAMLVEIVNT